MLVKAATETPERRGHPDEKIKKAAGKGDKKPDAKRVRGAREGEAQSRAGSEGDGRVYRIAYRVSDGRGGTCTGVEKVAVPVKRHKTAVDTKSFNSFG